MYKAKSEIKPIEIENEELAQVYEIEQARQKRDERRANLAKDKEKRERKFN